MSPRQPIKLSAFENLIDAMNREGVRYLIAGGIAVIAHGYARLTMDLDVVLLLEEGNIRKALSLYERLGYRPALPVPASEFANRETRARWIREKNMTVFQMIHEEHGFPPIDLFIDSPFDFEKESARSEFFEMREGLRVPIISLATLIEMKELANRDRDRIDLFHLRRIGQDNGGDA